MNKFWDDYPQIQAELTYVNKVIGKSLKSRNKPINDALAELLSGGGKLLRPAFVLIAHSFGKTKSKDVQTLAAVMEMLHMATLVHDDIIDEASLRRGKETMQHKYGKHFAVYVGDYILCVCFNLLAKTNSANNIQIDARSMGRICIGEVEQFYSRFNKKVNIREYLKRISYKTAELFSLSFYVGALDGKCDERLAKKLSYIGHNIGMAFQIIDDLLDYFGEEESVGKPVCSDLKQGLYTLPVIYGLMDNNKELDALVSKEAYDKEDISKIIGLLNSSGSFEKTRNLAKQYTDKAFKLINSLPQSENKDILIDITKKLLIRNY